MSMIKPLLWAALLWLFPAVGWGATIVLVAGGGEDREPVAATAAKLVAPFAVDFDRDGRLIFVEMKGERVRAIDSNGQLTTIAGDRQQGASGDGGPAAAARFNGMHHLAISPGGDIYLADTWNHCIRKIDPQTSLISRFAGTGHKAFGGDGGPPASADFGGVYCLAFGPKAEKMYVADLDNRRIRSINMQSGEVATFAGNGKKGIPRDGRLARNEPLVDPRAVAADASGNVYVLERSGNALRVVNEQGEIHTLIGPNVKVLDGQGADEQLPLKGPKHLCIDRDGNVLICDTENHLIRKYLPGERKLVRIAGTGKPGAAGLGGPPEQAELNQPHGVFVHPSGAFYIADSTNNRIVKVEP